MAAEKSAITILIIDDDDFTRHTATTILKENLPYDVLTASSGMDGVDVLK